MRMGEREHAWPGFPTALSGFIPDGPPSHPPRGHWGSGRPGNSRATQLLRVKHGGIDADRVHLHADGLDHPASSQDGRRGEDVLGPMCDSQGLARPGSGLLPSFPLRPSGDLLPSPSQHAAHGGDLTQPSRIRDVSWGSAQRGPLWSRGCATSKPRHRFPGFSQGSRQPTHGGLPGGCRVTPLGRKLPRAPQKAALPCEQVRTERDGGGGIEGERVTSVPETMGSGQRKCGLEPAAPTPPSTAGAGAPPPKVKQLEAAFPFCLPGSQEPFGRYPHGSRGATPRPCGLEINP